MKKAKSSNIILIVILCIIVIVVICLVVFKFVGNEKYPANSTDYLSLRKTFLEKNISKALSSHQYQNAPLKDKYIVLSKKEELVGGYLNKILLAYLAQYDPPKNVDPKVPNVTPKQPFPPHCYFPSVKHLYENNDIFPILDDMPKGGLLHIHSGAVGDLDWILDTGIFMTGPYEVTTKSTPKPTTEGSFWLNKDILFAIDGEMYIGKELFKFKDSSPGPNWQQVTKTSITHDIKQRIKERLFMSNVLNNTDTPQAWKAFETINDRYGELRDFEKYALESVSAGLLVMAKNKIQHVDIRFGFGPLDQKVEKSAQPEALIKKTVKKIKTFIEALALMKKQNSIYNNFTMKIILATPRIVSVADLQTVIETAYKLKSGKHTSIEIPTEVKDIITGYDLIAEEDANYRTLYYLDDWIKKQNLEAEYGVKLPFYFHDGESDWTSNENVVDAVLLDTKRIGHGFNIAFFPYIKEELIKRNICLEICPISNQVLQYFRDLRVHSANSLFREGVPMVIATDDPLQFGYSGLTYDFWVAVVSWGLTLKDIKCLVYNSILYSSLNETEIAKSIKELDEVWSSWIDRWTHHLT